MVAEELLWPRRMVIPAELPQPKRARAAPASSKTVRLHPSKSRPSQCLPREYTRSESRRVGWRTQARSVLSAAALAELATDDPLLRAEKALAAQPALREVRVPAACHSTPSFHSQAPCRLDSAGPSAQVLWRYRGRRRVHEPSRSHRVARGPPRRRSQDERGRHRRVQRWQSTECFRGCRGAAGASMVDRCARQARQAARRRCWRRCWRRCGRRCWQWRRQQRGDRFKRIGSVLTSQAAAPSQGSTRTRCLGRTVPHLVVAAAAVTAAAAAVAAVDCTIGRGIAAPRC